VCRVDDPPAAQDPVDLLRNYCRLQHVLENSLHDDAIDGAVRQRDCMAVGNELHDRALVDVECDKVDRGVGVYLLEAAAHGAAPITRMRGRRPAVASSERISSSMRATAAGAVVLRGVSADPARGTPSTGGPPKRRRPRAAGRHPARCAQINKSRYAGDDRKRLVGVPTGRVGAMP